MAIGSGRIPRVFALLTALLVVVVGCASGGRLAPSPGASVRDTAGGPPVVRAPLPDGPGAADSAHAAAEDRPGESAASPGTGLAVPPAGAELPGRLRRRTLDVAVRSVRDGYFDRTFAGINWDSIVAFYRPRALAASRSEPFHEMLARMLAAMGVSHTVVLSPERLAAERAREPGWTGAEVRRLPEGWVVMRVAERSPADSSGLRAGDVVDSISGVAAAAIGRAGTRPWLSASEALRGSTGAVNGWLAGTRGAVVVLVVRDTLGQRRTVRMTSAPFPGPSARIGSLPPARAVLETRRLEGGVGYIRFSAFVPDLEPRIQVAIRGMHDAPGLILDLRGNPGGYDQLGDHIASMLVRSSHLLTTTISRRGVREDRAEPVPDGYPGPVVVLLDGLSASASEQFAAPMQEIGRVRVVGERSAGADLEAGIVTLPTGGALMYPIGEPRTPAGRVIEGAGVTPDLSVPLTRLGLARGHDAQLDAALAELRRLAALPPATGAAPAPVGDRR